MFYCLFSEKPSSFFVETETIGYEMKQTSFGKKNLCRRCCGEHG